ncbi:MAG: hypothetical protein E7029_04295 [Planctomycetaceae bacterium]|nr:hypothetical protein [Planctomycetaceae bacterium]
MKKISKKVQKIPLPQRKTGAVSGIASPVEAERILLKPKKTTPKNRDLISCMLIFSFPPSKTHLAVSETHRKSGNGSAQIRFLPKVRCTKSTASSSVFLCAKIRTMLP